MEIGCKKCNWHYIHPEKDGYRCHNCGAAYDKYINEITDLEHYNKVKERDEFWKNVYTKLGWKSSE